MNKQVDCNRCPCLNNDADYGYSCNLGYKIKSSMFGAGSKECKLIKIVFVSDKNIEEEFTPEESND